MEKGDLLVLASDGIADAVNLKGEMYDETRFVESIRRHSAQNISDFVGSLYRSLSDFTQNAEVHDDITILALRRSD